MTQHSLKPIRPACSFPKRNGQRRTCLQKAIKKSDTAADRLDKARAAIPKQTKITKERVFDEAKGKAKTRLAFEKTDKPPNGKLRHNPLSRPAQELDAAVHGKIYEVEMEKSMRWRKKTSVWKADTG